MHLLSFSFLFLLSTVLWRLVDRNSKSKEKIPTRKLIKEVEFARSNHFVVNIFLHCLFLKNSLETFANIRNFLNIFNGAFEEQ